jgi:flavodoxin
MKKRILVAYYSRTGHVRTVARMVAVGCNADLEEIRDVRNRRGLLAWFRSVREARWQALPEIGAPGHDPAEYDLIVLGTPVWAGAMASPMRTYISRQGLKFREIALLVTM